MLGVLTAVGINAWWQGRQDAEQEQAYLLQLRSDLAESELDLDGLIKRFHRQAVTAAGIVHSFWQDAPPPQDSLVEWLRRPLTNIRYRPNLGTAEAIVSTGDLRLISDASLRTKIVEYIESIASEADIVRYEETYYRRGVADLSEVLSTGALSVMGRDSTYDPSSRSRLFSAPPLYDRVPFPVDFDTLLKDRRLHDSYRLLLTAHRNTMFRYEEMLEETQELRAHVERAL